MMPLERLKQQLIRHEGEVLHAYQDPLGFWTIGVGRLIDKRRGGGISHEEAMMLLDGDIIRVVSSLERHVWFRRLDPVRQQATANMAFQLGVTGLLGFRRMIAALKDHDYELAADEALDSRWATQTPNRADEIAAMIRDGE